MATPLPGSIPASITTVEQLMVYSVELYRRVAAGRSYSERSDTDRRPFMQVSIDDVFAPENSSQHFIIFRGAVPLNPEYSNEAKKLWQDPPGLNGSITVPAGFTD